MADTIRDVIRAYVHALSETGDPPGDGDDLLGEGAVQSMHVLELVTFLEERFGVTVEPGDLYGGALSSVDSMVDFVLRSRRSR